jgi:hypothetical protein
MRTGKITEDVILSASDKGTPDQQWGANNGSAQLAINKKGPTVTFQLNWWLSSNY